MPPKRHMTWAHQTSVTIYHCAKYAPRMLERATKTLVASSKDAPTSASLGAPSALSCICVGVCVCLQRPCSSVRWSRRAPGRPRSETDRTDRPPSTQTRPADLADTHDGPERGACLTDGVDLPASGGMPEQRRTTPTVRLVRAAFVPPSRERRSSSHICKRFVCECVQALSRGLSRGPSDCFPATTWSWLIAWRLLEHPPVLRMPRPGTPRAIPAQASAHAVQGLGGLPTRVP